VFSLCSFWIKTICYLSKTQCFISFLYNISTTFAEQSLGAILGVLRQQPPNTHCNTSHNAFQHRRPILCLIKHHTMKTYWGSGGIAPRILNLGTRRRWAISFMPKALTPRERALVPVVWEAEWVPEPVWTWWRRENIPAPAGNWTPLLKSVA
jgi:hypothetical protein